MGSSIYLDYAAATPLDPAVLAAAQPYFADKFYNPSALYLAAKEVAGDIAAARQTVAKQVGVRPAELIFTAGGTEANNLAIRGIMSQYPDGNLVVSSIEHESVLQPARQYSCKEAPVGADGRVDIDKLVESIDDNTVLVSVMYANNEVGTIQPLKEIGERLVEIRHARVLVGNTKPLYFHADACQAGNYLTLQAHRLYLNLMTLNGGKIYGPKQSGVLWVQSGVRGVEKLAPQILGGGQEYGMRSGTENVPAIMGFAKALEQTVAKSHEETKRLQGLQKQFFDLIEQQIPEAIVNGSRKHRLPNNVHITLPGQDNERLIMALDEAGIQAAAGSACSASSDEPSHVLAAMGMDEADIRASLRFTMGRGTTEGAVTKTIQVLKSLLQAP
jgi:cysteine desulfurase